MISLQGCHKVKKHFNDPMSSYYKDTAYCGNPEFSWEQDTLVEDEISKVTCKDCLEKIAKQLQIAIKEASK